MNCYKYEELSSSQLSRALDAMSLVYVPIGSLEFHGPHLPLGLDTIHAYEFCLQMAQRIGGIVMPPTYWGVCGHEGWTGSLLVSKETYRALMSDILRLLALQGVKLVVVMTGHYPAVQGKMVEDLAQEAMQKDPSFKVLVLDPFGINPSSEKAEHAGKIETSLMLAIRPDLVHMDTLGAGTDFKGIAKDCVAGTKEFGDEYFRASIQSCTSIVLGEWNRLLADKAATGDCPRT